MFGNKNVKQGKTDPTTQMVNLVGDFLRKSAGTLAYAGVDPLKFADCAREAMFRVPNLQNANKNSLIAAMRQCCMDGLLPDGRQAAMFVDKKGLVRYYPMKDGYKAILWRAVKASIKSGVIYEKDKFTVTKDGIGDDNIKIESSPFDTDRGKLIGAWCVIKVPNQPATLFTMNVEAINKIRNISPNKNNDFNVWKDWPDEMSEKSVIKKGCRGCLHLINTNDSGKGQHYAEFLERENDFKNANNEGVVIDGSASELDDKELKIEGKTAATPTESENANIPTEPEQY